MFWCCFGDHGHAGTVFNIWAAYCVISDIYGTTQSKACTERNTQKLAQTPQTRALKNLCTLYISQVPTTVAACDPLLLDATTGTGGGGKPLFNNWEVIDPPTPLSTVQVGQYAKLRGELLNLARLYSPLVTVNEAYLHPGTPPHKRNDQQTQKPHPLTNHKRTSARTNKNNATTHRPELRDQSHCEQLGGERHQPDAHCHQVCPGFFRSSHQSLPGRDQPNRRVSRRSTDGGDRRLHCPVSLGGNVKLRVVQGFRASILHTCRNVCAECLDYPTQQPEPWPNLRLSSGGVRRHLRNSDQQCSVERHSASRFYPSTSLDRGKNQSDGERIRSGRQ